MPAGVEASSCLCHCRPPAPKSCLTVGGERDGDGIDARQLLDHLLGSLAERFELRGPGRIDRDGEIDLAAADDDLETSPSETISSLRLGPLTRFSASSTRSLRMGSDIGHLCIPRGPDHQQSNCPVSRHPAARAGAGFECVVDAARSESSVVWSESWTTFLSS